MLEDPRTEAERRLHLAPGQFPFRSHFLHTSGACLHYVDEGAGPTLFMLHGNPTWSFLYRHIISGLKNDYRCIALDLPGFGLSQPPERFDYRPDQHAGLVAGFLESLRIRDATLIGHDWGVPIGLSAMLQTSGCIRRLCIGNSWAWPVNDEFHFQWFSKLMGGPIGRFGAERFALFLNVLLPWSMQRRKLSKTEMLAYRAPFGNGRSRRPMHVFPWEITAATAWLGEIQTRIADFEGPVLLVWPDNDIAFRAQELRRWQKLLPQAATIHVPKCGHYLWEDAPEDCINALRNWLVAQDARLGSRPAGKLNLSASPVKG